MFLERLVNQAGSPVLEQMLNFTAARHKLILENLANVGAQGYRQKDLDLKKFQGMLRDRVENRDLAEGIQRQIGRGLMSAARMKIDRYPLIAKPEKAEQQPDFVAAARKHVVVELKHGREPLAPRRQTGGPSA